MTQRKGEEERKKGVVLGVELGLPTRGVGALGRWAGCAEGGAEGREAGEEDEGEGSCHVEMHCQV